MKRAALAVVALASLTGPAFGQTLADRVNQEEARKHYQSGEKLMTEEAFEGAVREFTAATELDPNFTMAYYSLGQALMSLKRYPEAVTAYTSSRDSLYRLSNLDQKQRSQLEQQRRDAIRDLEETLQRIQSGKVKGTGGSTISMEVPIQDRLRMLKDMEHKGAESGVRVPAELSLALGSAYFRQNLLEDAEREYREATKANDKLGAAHNNLAVIYMLTGRFDEAKDEVKAAEKAGFPVSPRFKEDLKTREQAAKESKN